MTENCPACNADDTIEVLKWAKGHTIHKCGVCGLIFTRPLPGDEQLDQLYQGFMFRKPDERQIAAKVEARKAELRKLFDIEGIDKVKAKAFLDYGGGVGIATKGALELGLDAFYFDIDLKAAAFVRTGLGIDEGRIFTDLAHLAGRKFDLILSDNSIEHAKSPRDFIGMLYDLLAPNGLLVIKTPHAANNEILFYPQISLLGYFGRALKYNGFAQAVRGFGRRWWHCDPPRHLYSFSENSLRHILRTLGIDRYEFDYYRLPLFRYSIPELIFARPRKAKKILPGILALPLLPIELITKLTQIVLTALGLVSPGGIILKVKR